MSAVIIDDWDVSCVADTCCAGGGPGEFNADFAYAGGSLIRSTKWSSSAPPSGVIMTLSTPCFGVYVR